ncbi:MAG: MoxR family ATPase [Bacteroidetes bacterium]|nr:MoxR family ATPase [Bacteroidota bacterium]
MQSEQNNLFETIQQIKREIAKVIVGQENMVHLLMVALLADGHVLIEGVPGVAKTLTAKLLARTLDVPFNRIQFTPDLMPSDVIGTSVFNPQTAQFNFRKGPVFGQLILIDEINRAPAKTQAALFEVMEERQISYDGVTYKMEEPYMVCATQNPIEHEGTYRLPEAQLDRFLLKIVVPYPTLQDEIGILKNSLSGNAHELLNGVAKVLNGSQVIQFRDQVNNIHVEENMLKFIAEIVQETRNNSGLFLGASPRASIAILHCAKASAALKGRSFVTPDDIVEVLNPVLSHRIILTPEKEMEGADEGGVLEEIVKKIEVPR